MVKKHTLETVTEKRQTRDYKHTCKIGHTRECKVLTQEPQEIVQMHLWMFGTKNVPEKAFSGPGIQTGTTPTIVDFGCCRRRRCYCDCFFGCCCRCCHWITHSCVFYLSRYLAVDFLTFREYIIYDIIFVLCLSLTE